MQELTPAIADRIAAFTASGKSFFTIAKFHGMPPSRQIRLWTLNDHGFRDKIAKARLMRPPRHSPPKSDDPATWGIDEEQRDFSEQHGVFLPVEVKMGLGKTVQRGMRRAPDARMFDSFTPEQERAYHRIAAAVKIRVMGMGYKPSNLHRVDGGSSAGSHMAKETDLMGDYDEWQARCKAKGLKTEIAMDMVALGMNLAESAQNRGCDWRTVRKILNACLDQYEERRGRPKGKYDDE